MAFPEANFSELLKSENREMFARWLEEVTGVSVYIPTEDEAAALEGSGGAPSGVNKYVVESYPALAGTYGTPGTGNEFVTSTDPRLSITIVSDGELTLDNGGGTTTTVADTAVTASCRITITPTSANAAAAVGSATGVYVSAKNVGTSFVVTHPASPGAGATMEYQITD